MVPFAICSSEAMMGFRLLSLFIFLSAISTIWCKCKEKSISSLLEEELKNNSEIALHDHILYDSGNILKWNCSDETGSGNKSCSEEEEESPVALNKQSDGNIIFGNSSGINTYTMIYRKTLPYINEIITEHSENTTRPSFKVTSNEHNVQTNKTRNSEEQHSVTSNRGGAKYHSNSDGPFYNIPVNILLGEKHGITILNATYPETSMLYNYTDIDAYSIDYQIKNGTIVYTGEGKIMSTGQPHVVVATGVDGPVRLALDWLHSRLYWLSDKYQTFEVVNLDGTNRRTMADNIPNIAYPNNIAVDPYRRFVFLAANKTVYRDNLNGGNLQRINWKDNSTKTVKCLALDIPSKRLFVSGKLDGKPYIASTNYEGGAVEYYDISDTDWNDLYSIDVFRDVIYFANYEPGTPDSIWNLNISWTGKRPVHVYTAPKYRGGIWGLKVYDSEVQEQSDKLGT